MRVLQTIYRCAFFSAILLIGLGCKRGKLPVEGGGSPARTDESKTTTQVVQNTSARSDSVLTPPKSDPDFVDVGEKKQAAIRPNSMLNADAPQNWATSR